MRLLNQMAAFAACRHASKIGTDSGVLYKFKTFSVERTPATRILDTLALVRKLEAGGIPSKQSEAITSAITEVLNASLENVASKGEILKIEMTQECNFSKFKSEVQSSQGHQFSVFQHESEKRRSYIERMHGELRSDMDKVAATLTAQIEAAKYDVMKYCVGIVSISAVGLAIIRILN